MHADARLQGVYSQRLHISSSCAWRGNRKASVPTDTQRVHDIAGSVLYVDIIAEHVPSLLFGALKGPKGWDPRSARKLGLLRHCRSLVLEPPRLLTDD